MLEFTHGDMFETPADIRVNTVNCVGVMGAGVALAFKQRYPEMFQDYQRECKGGRVMPGRMHVWKSLSGDWIVNFPTKRDWREPSRYEDIDAGLDDLRGYLETIGPVTVALPALGCGHGGLDWARVSGMIREKLEGVEARVLVFAPAASRHAGRTAIEAPTDDERRSAANLGYEIVAGETQATSGTSTAYVLGEQDHLSRKWIALLPSRAPAEREVQALRAIAAELGRSKKKIAVALVHGARASEEVAQLFARQGVNVVMLLPFGILTRKPIAKLPAAQSAGRLTLVSTAPANAKWSRQLFAQSMDVLRNNAAALLVSDPQPDWLAHKGLGKWLNTPVSYIRYETTPSDVREALTGAGARPIGRRGEDGAPNIDHLLDGAQHHLTSEVQDPATGSVQGAGEPSAAAREALSSDDGARLAASFGALPHAVKRELFDALLRMNVTGVDISVRLAKSAEDADLLRLIELGFSQRQD